MAAHAPFPRVLPMRERAGLITRLTRQRLEDVLPTAMRAGNLDAWLVLCQEDNLDPIFTTMIPMDTWCPILQILLFIDRGNGQVDRYNLSGTNTHDLFARPYIGQHVPDQWAHLLRLLDEADLQRIGVNIGSVQWAAGGLTVNLHRQLIERLPARLIERIVSAEDAAVHWATSLTSEDVSTYEHVCNIAHAVIAETYSRAVITPGYTTLDDLTWGYWQRCADLGLPMSFQPSFRLIRSRAMTERFGLIDRVLRPGDFIHCDVGFQYLRFHSDHQQIAYILKQGETEAPAGLRALLAEANRLQDIFMSEFVTGRSGDELLGRILARAHAEEIPGPKVYSHSVGLFLHEPGPLIGLPWEQVSIPGRGDVRLIPNSCFTLELSVTGQVAEWDGEEVRLPLEEDIFFDGLSCRLLDGRQTQFHIV